MASKTRSLPAERNTLGGELRWQRELRGVTLSAMSSVISRALKRSINPGYLSLLERNKAHISADIVTCIEEHFQLKPGTLMAYFDRQPLRRQNKRRDGGLAYRPLMVRFDALQTTCDEMCHLLKTALDPLGDMAAVLSPNAQGQPTALVFPESVMEVFERVRHLGVNANLSAAKEALLALEDMLLEGERGENPAFQDLAVGVLGHVIALAQTPHFLSEVRRA